ncbi:hypothetical protein CMV_015497 [Castanea mollissima]|uniref:Uncharacterized protein n=1 Tax=Castanea mollissima TaxID=60419 RepID=A0A8J4QVE4_9ROSI|nr:hypothetical protein CMV_015497 [Castanea mollissima]
MWIDEIEITHIEEFRYAYSEETGDDFEEEAILLTGGGIMVAGYLATMLEIKERILRRTRENNTASLFSLYSIQTPQAKKACLSSRSSVKSLFLYLLQFCFVDRQ